MADAMAMSVQDLYDLSRAVSRISCREHGVIKLWSGLANVPLTAPAGQLLTEVDTLITFMMDPASMNSRGGVYTWGTRMGYLRHVMEMLQLEHVYRALPGGQQQANRLTQRIRPEWQNARNRARPRR